MEQWRPIVGFEGYYEVSDLGRVHSLDRWVDWTDRQGRLIRGKDISVFLGSDGYPRVNLWRDNRGTVPLVHVLMMESFVGPCPSGQESRHKDGDGSHCVLTNLEYGTRGENTLDQVRMGRHNNATKTACAPAGHALFPPNLQNSKDGGRRCLTCDRARGRARWRGIRKGTPEWFTLLDECYREIMGT